MWLARFLVDSIISCGVLVAAFMLFGTGLDLVKRIAGAINKMVRNVFKLDDDKAWGMGPKTEFKDRF